MRLPIAVSLAALAAGTAAAQTATLPADTVQTSAPDATAAPAPDTGEVVITARRVSENLQDVPVAVTAFGAAQLTARGVDTLDQVAKFTPNIRFDGAAALSGGNFNPTVFIRGVGQNDFAIFSDPGVGFYVDDVYYARSIGGVLDAIDLESVQVLRGPQGTLFGKNTIGGAVLVTTGTPDPNQFTGRIEGAYGRFDRIDVKGFVNIPLAADKAALRISAASINRDGYVRRLVDGSTLGNRNSDTIRAKLRLLPTERLTIDFSGDYTRARENSAPSKLLAVGNAAAGLSGVPFLVNWNRFVAPTRGIVAPNGQRTVNSSFITDSPFTTFATGENRNDLDLWGGQGIVRYDLGGAELKSITAYRDLKAGFNRDGDNTPFTFRETANDDKQWQFSQEVQLSGKALDDRLGYVFGVYYLKEKASDIARADIAPGLNPGVALVPPFSPAVFIQNYTNNYSIAAYGQLTYQLTDQLGFEVGGRWSKDNKIFTSINTRQRDNVTFINVTREDDWKDFTPHFGVNYKATDDILIYGSYSRGFKQGGFNGRPLAGPEEVTAYAPETLDTYEAGIKAQIIDRKLTANLAYFHSKYNDIQLTVNQTPQNFVANAAGGKIDGFEAELVARPNRWFNANMSVGYLDARYTSVGQGLGPTQILPITLATGFVKAPKWTATVGAEARHEFDGGGIVALRGDLTLYSRIYHDVANTPIITDDGYTISNARISYTLPGNAIEVAAFVNNLTNTLYLLSGNASPGFGLAEASYGRPREWGVSASYRF
ncbi:MAG: TonB-dependent receptor [Sphingomonas fennica]